MAVSQVMEGVSTTPNIFLLSPSGEDAQEHSQHFQRVMLSAYDGFILSLPTISTEASLHPHKSTHLKSPQIQAQTEKEQSVNFALKTHMVNKSKGKCLTLPSKKEKKVKGIHKSKGVGTICEKYPSALSPNNLLSGKEKQLHMYPVNIISIPGT